MASRRWVARQSAFCGEDIGPNPTDRAKNGTKTNLLVEGQGGPLAVSTAPANWHDATCLEDALYSIVVPRPDEDEHLLLAKGYDNRNRSANPVPSQVARFELKRASGWV